MESDGVSSLVDKMKDYCPPTDQRFSPRRICVIFGLASLFVALITGSSIMWFTDIYYDEIINQITIREGSEVYEAWRKPPVNPLICAYIFNYTNIEEYKKGIDEKIKIEETGPYCYREYLEKKNVTFNDDGTVTYGDTRSHKFEPDHSKGSKDDLLYVPNLGLIAAVAVSKDFNKYTQLGISFTMRSVLHYSDTMIKVSAHDFLFGYQDRLFEIGSLVAKALQKKLPFEKLGILTQRSTESDETTTVRTGTNDVERIGIVTEINGMDKLSVWSDDECNRIDGSDGAFFPRHTINESATLYLFHKNICRRMPFVFQKEVQFQDDVMGMRFHAAPDVYNTNGTCFCPAEGCAPDGVFDLSPCSEGIPLMISFPHFLNADPSVSEPFEGLKPDPEKHEFYIDIQRLLGFTLGTVSRLQFNIKIQKSKYTTLIKEFPDGLILPVVWMEISAERIPPDLYNFIYHATFTVKRMEIILMWFSLLSTILVGVALFLYTRSLLKNSTVKKTDLGESQQAAEKMLPLELKSIQLCKVSASATIRA